MTADAPGRRCSTINDTQGSGTIRQALARASYRGVCGKCGAVSVDSQLGLEATPDLYVAALVAVFREVARVLKPAGTVWLNLGDSYIGGNTGQQANVGQRFRDDGRARPFRKDSIDALKPKNLVGIPWRVAFALQADGWYLRSDIIWSKPNPMPESVTDRPTKAHEYLFLLSKSERYFYDAAAIMETAIPESEQRYRTAFSQFSGGSVVTGQQTRGSQAATVTWTGQRNKRTVWTLPTMPYAGAHFATMPEALVEPCILAGCPLSVCAKCGLAINWLRVNTKMQMVQRAVSSLSVAAQGREGELLQPAMRVPVEAKQSGQLPGVREADPIREAHADEQVLQSTLFESLGCADAFDLEGFQPDSSRLPGDLRARASDGDADWLRARASSRDGVIARSQSSVDGSRSSQERDQAGQSPGESRASTEASSRCLPEAEAAALPPVSIVLGRDLSVPQCEGCGAELTGNNVQPGVVLDPFLGSGTVGAVAERLGRRWVGTDLSYQPLSKARTAQRGIRFEEASA